MPSFLVFQQEIVYYGKTFLTVWAQTTFPENEAICEDIVWALVNGFFITCLTISRRFLCWNCPWTAWPRFVHCIISFFISFNDITHCWEIRIGIFTYFTTTFILLSQKNRPNSISQKFWKFYSLGRHYLPFKYKRKLRSSSCKIEWTLMPAMTSSALFCLCFIDF